MGQTIRLLPEKMVLLRYGPGDAFAIPSTPGFFALTRTANELSIVMEEASAPKKAPKRSAGWRLFEVAGPFELNAIGIMASITAPLAAASVSMFALATYDTDYFLVAGRQSARAVRALREAGHIVEEAR